MTPTPGSPVPPVPTCRLKRPTQIFQAGTFGGFDYSVEFLQAAVDNFKRYQAATDPKGFPKPPAFNVSSDELKAAGIGIGHEDVRLVELARKGDETAAILAKALMDKTDRPACGWVSDMFMVGEAVFAMLEGVPLELASAIEGGLYRYCSAEWYKDYVGASGTHYGPMLRRVSILGGELPQLKFLGRLPPMVFSEMSPAGGQVILCFSEVRSMTHEELVIALSAFIPNVAGLVADGFDDTQLEKLLKAMQGDKPTPADPDPNPTPAPGILPNSDPKPEDKPILPNAEDKPNVPATFAEVKKLETSLRRQLVITVQQNAATQTLLKRLDAEARNKDLKDVEAFCESMVKAGKVRPEEMLRTDANGKPKPNLVDRLMAHDAVNKVFAFGETKISTREAEMEEIRNRRPVARFSEVLPQDITDAAKAGREKRRVEALAATPLGQKILNNEARAAGLTTTADGRRLPPRA